MPLRTRRRAVAGRPTRHVAIALGAAGAILAIARSGAALPTTWASSAQHAASTEAPARVSSIDTVLQRREPRILAPVDDLATPLPSRAPDAELGPANTAKAADAIDAPAVRLQPATGAPPDALPDSQSSAPAPVAAAPAAAAPLPAAPPAPMPFPQADGSGLSSLEQQLLAGQNTERAKAGLPPLRLDAALEGVARRRANDMAARGYFSHTSPTGQTAFSLIDEAGIYAPYAGENVGYSLLPDAQSVSALLAGFMASASHRANIVDPMFSRVGVAMAVAGNGTKYYAVVFAGP